MKTLTLALALAIIPLTGCINPEPEGKSFCDERCVENENNNPNTNNNPVELPLLKGAFISGHLGSYWDCPDEAYGGPSSGIGSDGAAPEGDCAPGEDGTCGGLLSCESAQVTITLSNGGDTDATNILVDQVELFGADGVSRAVLPLNSTYDTETNEAFDGTLAAGDEVILRVEFQGPYNAYELLQPADGTADEGFRAGGGGILKTTFSSDNHEDLTVESGELFEVPGIDT